MTPTPEPTEDAGAATVAVLGFEAVVLFVLGLVISLIVLGVVVRLSQHQPRVMVPFLVLIVTLTALVLFAITREEGLETIAATGLGALAGALTYLYQQQPTDDETDDE